MGTVVGLGQAGCNIAKLFSQYPQYEAHYIDSFRDKEKTGAISVSCVTAIC